MDARQAMAILGMGSMVGGIIGPALGGVLTDWLSWHAIFFVSVPLGLLACVGMYLFIDPSTKRSNARDRPIQPGA
jgi:DHA2 family multidrug resistance protein